VDGEGVEVNTHYIDQLTAERAAGANPLDTPINLQAHVWYAALRRQHPEHAAGRTFRGFVESLWGAEDLTAAPADEDDTDADEVAGNGLDPTRPVASAG
jgi:hypothetical protein